MVLVPSKQDKRSFSVVSKQIHRFIVATNTLFTLLSKKLVVSVNLIIQTKPD